MAVAGNKLNFRAGFTLVEVLLVLVIIATLAALATPALRGFTKSRLLPNTAAEFVTTARWCHQQAISQGVAYRLNMDTENGAWFVTMDDGTGQNFTAVNTSNFVPERFVLPEGIRIETTIPSAMGGKFITFDAGGKCDLGVVTLTSENTSVSMTCDTPRGTYYVVAPKAGG